MPARGSDDMDAAQRAEETRRALEAGGLPLAARERLANLKASGGRFSTSNLTANEFLLIRQAGFRPIAQVMGSSFFNIGWQFAPGNRTAGGGYVPPGWGTRTATSGGFEYDRHGRRIYVRATFGQLFELETITEAWQQARYRALGRLRQEAVLAGAEAVVGVRLRRRTSGRSKDSIEFVATGTAVTAGQPDHDGEPVLSTLSGQEFAKLYANGFRPAGIVADTAVVYVMIGSNQRSRSYWFSPNTELVDFTQGVEHARRLAVSRVARAGRDLSGTGVVGLSLELGMERERREGQIRRRDMVVTAHAIGTAIVAVDLQRATPPVEMLLTLGGAAR